jgi:hypothetical protein
MLILASLLIVGPQTRTVGWFHWELGLSFSHLTSVPLASLFLLAQFDPVEKSPIGKPGENWLAGGCCQRF